MFTFISGVWGGTHGNVPRMKQSYNLQNWESNNNNIEVYLVFGYTMCLSTWAVSYQLDYRSCPVARGSSNHRIAKGRGFKSHPSNMHVILFVHSTLESCEYTVLTHVGVWENNINILYPDANVTTIIQKDRLLQWLILIPNYVAPHTSLQCATAHTAVTTRNTGANLFRF